MIGSLDRDWKDVFLTSAGRMARLPFVLACAALLLVDYAYETLVGRTGHWITGWAYYPVLIFCAASVLSKRLHDRGRAGWWSALVLLAVWMVWPRPAGVMAFLAIPVLVWALVELAGLPGEAGENRYGPSPRESAPAA